MEKPLEKPYTNEEMQARIDENGQLSGTVGVTLSEIIGSDFESFLDLLSERLTGSPCLTGTDYKALYMITDGVDDPVIAFKVTGGTELILENENSE